jgi:hypothetical protein
MSARVRIPVRTRAGRTAQRGAAFYLFVMSVAIAMSAAVLAAARRDDTRDARDRVAQAVLRDARAALLAELAQPDLDVPATGRRLGDLRAGPDLPIAAGPGNDAAEPVYDGLGEPSGCAYRGWLPGAPLRTVATAGAALRCFGRLPWRELGLSLPATDAADTAGLVPWVVVSPNLAAQAACLPDLTPLALGQPYAGFGCTGAPQFPWITVLDERGNLLSDRVAIALVLPGPAQPGQVRGAAADPAQYLDRATLGAGCPAPCQPGVYDNAGYNHPDGQPTVLIAAPRDPLRAQALGYTDAPWTFNDRIAWVTIDEVLAALETRARRELVRALLAFRTAHGYFPYAAPLNSGTGDCAPGLRIGHPPAAPGGCGAAEVLALPAWFTAAGWHRYFVYAASPRCVAANASCTAPGLSVGPNAAVNALVIGPGAPVTSAPFTAAKAGVQQPLSGLLLSANAADYLDAIENAGGTPDVFVATAGQSGPANDRLEIVE